MLQGIGSFLSNGAKWVANKADGLLQQAGIRKPPVEVVRDVGPHIADGANDDDEFVVSRLTLGEEDVGAFIGASLRQITTGANLAAVLEGVESLLRHRADPQLQAALATMSLANLQRLAVGISPSDKERVADTLVRLASVGNSGAVDTLLALSSAGQPLGDRTAMVKDMLAQTSMASPRNPHLLRCLCGLAEMKFREPSHLFRGEDQQLQKIVACRDLLIALRGSADDPMVRGIVSHLDLGEINHMAANQDPHFVSQAHLAKELLAMHRDFLTQTRR